MTIIAIKKAIKHCSLHSCRYMTKDNKKYIKLPTTCFSINSKTVHKVKKIVLLL